MSEDHYPVNAHTIADSSDLLYVQPGPLSIWLEQEVSQSDFHVGAVDLDCRRYQNNGAYDDVPTHR